MKTINLDILKDYLELVRNFVFGNGLVVIAGIVVQDRSSIGRLAALSIVWILVGGAFLYIAASIYYVEAKHRLAEAKRGPRVIAGLRAALLLVFMETSLFLVGHHVDRQNRAPSPAVVAKVPVAQASHP